MMTPLRTVSAPNKDRWLLSYADLLMLLLAFFVVMYSVSAVDAERLAKVSSGLELAFNAGGMPVTETPMSVAQSLVDFLPETVNVSAESSEWFEIVIGSSLLFGAGSATLREDDLMLDILPLLRRASGDIVVEGHTDNQPIETKQYPSNWALSAARAAAVVQILEGQGLAAQRLAALGLGASRPLGSNDSAAGRAQNRRVIIKIRQQGFDAAGLVSATTDQGGASVLHVGLPPTTIEAEADAAEYWLEGIDPSMLEEILDDMEKQEARPIPRVR